MIIEGNEVDRSYNEQVDVVIIGSGCGGATVAKQLAAEGHSVLILEQGGYFTAQRGDFDQRSDNMLARIDGGRGLHTSVNNEIALMYGNCVGGASVHYWADSWRMPKDRCDEIAATGVTGHSYEELTPYFEQIEKDHNVHFAAPEYYNTMNRLFNEGAQTLGWHAEPTPQARRGCAKSGHCYQGCAYDAKQSQLVTYVPAAIEAGAKLMADCQVETITRNTKGVATGVEAVFVDRANGRPNGHRLQVKARIVVLAAGGYSSSVLWLRAKLPNSSGQVGKNFLCNPNTLLYALYDREIKLWENIPAATGTSQYRLATYKNGEYVEGGYLLHPNQLQPEFLAVTLPGFGESHRQLVSQLPNIGSVVSWIDDELPGEIRLNDKGEAQYHYQLRGVDELKARDSLKKQAQLLFATGAREVIVPDTSGTRLHSVDEIDLFDELPITNGEYLFGAPHPAGALRMGSDPATSVVASNHEAHEVPNLFVADPSVFPLQPSVDPSISIMAWSYVAAKEINTRLHEGVSQ